MCSSDLRSNTFTFNGAVYTPAASHRGTAPDVTISWAGVKSENLASVWSDKGD